MYFAESKRGRPVRSQGFTTNWEAVAIATATPIFYRFFAEDGKGGSIRFPSFEKAKSHAMKTIGVAVARYQDDDGWQNARSWVHPSYKGKVPSLRKPNQKPNQIGTRREPLVSLSKPSRASDLSIKAITCY